MDLDTSDLISIHYPIAPDTVLQFNSQDIAMSDPDPGQQNIHTISSAETKWHSSSISGSTECMDFVVTEDRFRNGNCQLEHVIGKHLGLDDGVGEGCNDLLSLSDDGVPEISNSDLSVPEVCISTNTFNDDEDLSYECQQAYRIFSCFLLDKHKGITAPFLHPIGHRETHQGIGGVRGLGRGPGQGQLRQSMCLRRMEEKFTNREYETITEFVADFRLMLENCYRHHGVDHWVSKQAQKLEIMLEQKLTLLSRTLRERTALAVTSKGRFGAEEERGSGGTSTRRRSAPRSLATITVGGHESVMVQALRLEEQQRAKEERRQRELDKKEAEETSAKEVEEWERSLLSQTSPYTISTLWELPAIGHFLCLAQTALNLPEIIFFELERCLLMPRCSVFLSKIMSSLLCSPQRRPTLNRRPALPYRRWESELRQKVQGWYRAVGSAKEQAVRAGLLGLSYQFFQILGEVSPMEETPFHLLPVYQRVWLVKALCDNIYETQKDVQDVVLGQPIHECRESVLGYDGKDNAYIHFPHFCGADLRIYCQSPSTPPRFPLPAVWVRRVELAEGERKEAEDTKREEEERACDAASAGTERTSSASSSTSSSKEDEDEEDEKQLPAVFRGRNVGNGAWLLKGEESEEDSESSDEEDRKPDHSLLNTRTPSTRSRLNRDSTRGRVMVKVESKVESKPIRVSLKEGRGSPSVLGQQRCVKAEVPEPCLSVGEHSYMGRSPARSNTNSLSTQARSTGACVKQEGKMSDGHSAPCLDCSRPDAEGSRTQSEDHNCSCGGPAKLEFQQPVPDYPCKSNLTAETMEEDRIQTKKKKRKQEPGMEPCLGGIEEQKPQQGSGARTRQRQANAAKSSLQKEATAAATTKDKHKMEEKDSQKTSPRKTKLEEPVEGTFKLVCTSLEELRELISKTEDELDELESTKKRASQQMSWFQKRESVKELHITLIRLLNELSPWEPKLIKAFHRNRLRLKRDFDNFRKHPEYDNFVREECVSSSEDEEDMSIGSFTCSDPGRLTEEEDPLEHSVPRGLWSGDASRQLVTDSAGDNLLTRRNLSHNPLKRLSSSTDEDLSPHKRLCTTTSGNPTATSESLQQHRSKTDRPDSDQPPSEGSPQLPSRPVILHPTIGLPKGYTPIPTLLAKSVGNKVTLMKRPADHLSLIKQTHGQARVVSMPNPTLAKPPQAPSPLSPQVIPIPLHQKPTAQQHPPKQSVPVCRQLASATITRTTTTAAGNPVSQQTAAAPKTPVQLVYKMAEGLGHLLRKDSSSSSSPMKISVQPVVDQKTGEKTYQQVVLLPHNLLVPEKTAALPQQQQNQPLQQQQHQQQQLLLPQHPNTIPPPASKIPTAFSTSVSGFTIPDSKIPIQQVAPLKDPRTVRTPSPASSPRLQSPTVAASPGFKVVSLPCSPRASTPLSKTPSPSRSPISSPPAPAISSDTGIPSETRQELKTVCIRDSQSILVTTRGGNTGVVKVQSSMDPNSLGSLPTSPVISICPQFKAFLVSKSSLCPSAPLPSQSVSSSIPAAAAAAATTSSVAQPLPQLATIPTAIPASQATGSNVPFSLNHSYNITTVAKIGQASPTVVESTPVSVPPKSTMPVPMARSVPPANVLQCINKSALQAGVPDERSLFTKFILVSPPSSPAANVVPNTVASSPDAALSGSRVMFVSQSAPAFSKPSAGSAPNQPAASAADGQPARLPAEALSKLQSLTLPSGVQIRLPGRSTNTLSQTVCSLPQSPSVSTPGSGPRSGQAAATSSGLVFVRNPNMVTTTTTTISSSAGAGKTFSPSPPTAVTQPSLIRSPPAPVTATHHGLVNASTSPPVSGPQSHHSRVHVATTLAQPSATPPTTVSKVPHAQPSSLMKLLGASGNIAHPVTSAFTGTVQQRIVINTSAPLAAGTHIVLNGTRFVVPPQGLGPGSHVLIITSPAPPPTTSTTTTITAAGASPRGPSLATATPPSPAIPWASPVRLSGTPTLRPARLTVGLPGVVAAPRVSPLSAGGSSLRSTLSTVRLPGVLSPALGPPRLAGPVSPILTRTPALGTVVPSAKLPLTPCLPPHVLCRSSTAPGPPAPATLRIPVSTPVVPSTPVAGLPTPAIPSLAPLPPLLTQPTCVLTSPLPALGPTLLSHLGPGTATPRPPGTLLHKAALRLSAPSVHQHTVTGTGLTNAAVTAQVAPAVQTASPRAAQVLPMAGPSMGSRVFRMQSLPVATVPPSHIIKTSAQPFGKDSASDTISQPVLFSTATQAAPRTPLQSSAQLIHTNLTSSKPHVSPDGASQNTVQCLVHPAGLPVISTKHLAHLVVSPSSTAGPALPIMVPGTTTHTDSPHLQSAQPDSSEPINPVSS